MRALAVTIPSSVANMRGYGRARRRGIEERRGPRSPPNPANGSVRGGCCLQTDGKPECEGTCCDQKLRMISGLPVILEELKKFLLNNSLFGRSE